MSDKPPLILYEMLKATSKAGEPIFVGTARAGALKVFLIDRFGQERQVWRLLAQEQPDRVSLLAAGQRDALADPAEVMLRGEIA
jgi:hypothetical protein